MNPVRLHLTYNLWLTTESCYLLQKLNQLRIVYWSLTG